MKDFLFTIRIPGRFVRKCATRTRTILNELTNWTIFLYFCDPDRFVYKCGLFNKISSFANDISVFWTNKTIGSTKKGEEKSVHVVFDYRCWILFARLRHTCTIIYTKYTMIRVYFLVLVSNILRVSFQWLKNRRTIVHIYIICVCVCLWVISRLIIYTLTCNLVYKKYTFWNIMMFHSWYYNEYKFYDFLIVRLTKKILRNIA